MEQLRVGFAKSDMTPGIGCFLQGQSMPRYAEIVGDPLYIRSVVFENEGLAVLLYFDLCAMREPVGAQIREETAKCLGCSPEDVFVACTHTHTGPNVSNAAGVYDEAYVERLCQLAVHTALLAKNDLHPAQMLFAKDTLPGLSFVRRYYMKDGTVQTNPTIRDPNIDRPASEADESIQLLRIVREGAREIALVNFQCHADVIKTVGGKMAISADFPAEVCRTLEDALPGLDCIYCNGPCGDLNQTDRKNLPEGASRWGRRYCQHMGRTIAGKILSMYTYAQPLEAGPVRCAQRRIEIPVKKPTAEDIARSQQIVDNAQQYRTGEMKDTTTLYEAYMYLGLAKYPDDPKTQVSVFRVGQFALAGIPGEPFCEVGKRIRAQSPYELQFALCLTNGAEGYFPMMDAFSVNGYESRTTRFQPGVGELMADTAVALLQELADTEEQK